MGSSRRRRQGEFRDQEGSNRMRSDNNFRKSSQGLFGFLGFFFFQSLYTYIYILSKDGFGFSLLFVLFCFLMNLMFFFSFEASFGLVDCVM